MTSRKYVNAISRAASILKVLSQGIDRVSDISNSLQLSKSTVHRLLKTLEISQLVRQNPVNRRYYLGPLITNLASKSLIAHQNLVVSSFEEMKGLRDYSGETVILNIRIGLERICLEEIEGVEDLIYKTGKGSFAPIFAGSAGKVLLSELNDDELHFLLKKIHLIPLGPNTITDKRILLDELLKIKKQGYATSFGERIAGLAAISIPIKNYICPAALSIGGPESRMKPNIPDFLRKMKKSVANIESNII